MTGRNSSLVTSTLSSWYRIQARYTPLKSTEKTIRTVIHRRNKSLSIKTQSNQWENYDVKKQNKLCTRTFSIGILYLLKFFWNLLAAVNSCRIVAVFFRGSRGGWAGGLVRAPLAAVASASRAWTAPPDSPRDVREETSRQPGILVGSVSCYI